jgi:hypothetical protein
MLGFGAALITNPKCTYAKTVPNGFRLRTTHDFPLKVILYEDPASWLPARSYGHFCQYVYKS